MSDDARALIEAAPQMSGEDFAVKALPLLFQIPALVAEVEQLRRTVASVKSKTALDVVAEKMSAEDRADAMAEAATFYRRLMEEREAEVEQLREELQAANTWNAERISKLFAHFVKLREALREIAALDRQIDTAKAIARAALSAEPYSTKSAD